MSSSTSASGREQQNDLDHAIADFTMWIAFDLKNENAYRARGELYRKKNDEAAASADYAAAMTMSEKSAPKPANPTASTDARDKK